MRNRGRHISPDQISEQWSGQTSRHSRDYSLRKMGLNLQVCLLIDGIKISFQNYVLTA